MIKIKLLVSAVALATYGMAAAAQEPEQDTQHQYALEEVVVTATKRSQNMQDVPVAVTAFSADAISEAGINNAGDLAALTPSLHTTESRSPFSTRLAIRGVGTSQNDPSLEPSVGMFVDGVYLGRSGLGMSDLTDLERIEVLQGPQGTLYGKNTNAGAISIITKEPNLDEFEGYVELQAGTYGMTKMTVAATGPINDTLGYRVSGSVHQRDGYYENSAGPDLSDANDSNLQGKLLWEPTDNLRIKVGASHVTRDSNCCGVDTLLSDEVLAELAAQNLPTGGNDPYDFKISVDTPHEFNLESDAVSLHVTYDMDFGTFTSITAWNDYEYFNKSDSDQSALDIIRNYGSANAGDSISQEFRLDAELNESLEYQAGLFFYQSTTSIGDGSVGYELGDDLLTIGVQTLPVLGGIPPSVYLPLTATAGDTVAGRHVWDTQTLAAFGQVTWHATDEIHVSAGLRLTDETKEADLLVVNTAASSMPLPTGGSVSFVDFLAAPVDEELERDSQNVDWMLKVAHDLNEDTMVYASSATGTKSGNFNGLTNDSSKREFEDEHTISYELGIKSTLFDSRLRLNSALFYSKVTDFQIQEQTDFIGSFVSNDGEVVVSGLDISIDAMPFPILTLSGGLLYMDKYEVTEGANKGKKLPFTADVSGNIGGTVMFPMADGFFYMRADYVFMSEHLTGYANAGFTDERNLVNTNIGWRTDELNVSVWVKNLTEDKYASSVNAPQAHSGNKAHVLGQPRTIGATLRYNF